ncbi:Tox-REase-5 domain-containing protein [Sorangium cellulosum]|nr:Tox-REase-5 domain-containing protein [Sorangium cellulosum]
MLAPIFFRPRLRPQLLPLPLPRRPPPQQPAPSQLPPPRLPPPPPPPPLPSSGAPDAPTGGPAGAPDATALPLTSSPIADAKTEAEILSHAGTDTCATCKNCIALANGYPKWRGYSPDRDNQRDGYEYQHFIVSWMLHEPERGRIQEWEFKVWFDGIQPSICQLIEAKYGYDNFFELDKGRSDGRFRPQGWAITAIEDTKREARNQLKVVRPLYPEVKLLWVFSRQILYYYMIDYFYQDGLSPPIATLIVPYQATGRK